MDNLSSDIVKYKKGELSAEQMHALEKKALYDPFLAEALEGIEDISSGEFSKDVTAIDKIILNRKRTILFTPLRIAAGIIFISASVFIVYEFIPKAETIALRSEKKKVEIKNDESAGSGQLIEKGKTEGQKSEPKAAKERTKRDEPSILNNQVPIVPPSQPRNQNSEAEINHATEQVPVQSLVSTKDQQNKIENTESQKLNEIVGPEQKSTGGGAIPSRVKKDSFDKSEVQQLASSGPRKKAKSITDQKTMKEASSLSESKGDLQVMEDVSPQSEIVVMEEKDKAHEPVIHLAEPISGKTAYDNYLQANLKYPEEALKNKIKGTVGVEFTVGIDGSLSNFKVIQKLGYGCDEELLRLVKAGPKWTPSTADLKPRESKAKVLLIFDIEKAGK